MTSFAAPAAGAGITLVGEIVDLDPRNGSNVSGVSVRWLGITVDHAGTADPTPTRATPTGATRAAFTSTTVRTGTAAGGGDVWGSPAGAAPGGSHPGSAWGSGAFLASAMRAADGGGASFVPPQRSGADPRRPDDPDQNRRHGRRSLTESIRRLIDGPQGRHRRTHH